MKKLLCIIFMFCFGLVAFAGTDYNYISQPELINWLKQDKQVLVVDIQVKDEFAKKHIKKAIPTYAFPVKTEEQKKKVAEVLPQIKNSTLPVVIICPRGGGGAKNTYDYLKSQGVDENRLLILTGGMSTWTDTQFTELK